MCHSRRVNKAGIKSEKVFGRREKQRVDAVGTPWGQAEDVIPPVGGCAAAGAPSPESLSPVCETRGSVHLWALQGLTWFDSPGGGSLCCVVLGSALEGQGCPPRGWCPWGLMGLHTRGSRRTLFFFLVTLSQCKVSEVTLGPQSTSGLAPLPTPPPLTVSLFAHPESAGPGLLICLFSKSFM